MRCPTKTDKILILLPAGAGVTRASVETSTLEMSDKSEDGECSSSPKNCEIVEVLDNGGCFVLDRNDDALEEDVVVLNTSDMQSNEESNGDTNGDEDQSTKKNSHKNNWLKSTMASVMSLNEEEPKAEDKKKDNRRKPQCFNCLGEHNMVSCPEPKNHRRIRENRDAFNDARSKESRYIEPQSGQTGEFKPGRLSDNLQRALGIGPNDIPEYIYRMRKMGLAKGYPPGYLKNAVVKQTNPDDLLTFHSDNPELKGEEDDANERPLSPTVNSDKVIYYFGFNQTYRALRDRELRFSIPPFNEFVGLLNDHVKKEFWEERKREERKRKASSNDKGDHNEKRARKEEDDMILDAPPPPPIIDMSEVEEKKEEIEEEKEEVSLGKSSVLISPGGTPKSRRVSVGTPVLQRKNLGGGMKKVPSLDAFAVGIVPFHVDEPTPRTGFLQKMLKKIKDKLG
ncbi:hypothetical protein PRIPAC_91549 [Pristionchus pacificus]|uniref:PSP domain-containing protein n=1 Tax=Pristionchus pacificus TaxID=54126 RepID=A0A2A6B453_PRIPA|nr:hypothetical protein PRIPAC_91549 [Pristionchus pacificus]|eukprot:PDM60665.1 hypothetical protein PRIPAC_53934 [Pristionchus pacificus]